MPAAWDAQEALPAPGQRRRYQPVHQQQQQHHQQSPLSAGSLGSSHSGGAAAGGRYGSCGSSPGVASPQGKRQRQHELGSSGTVSGGQLLALANPLFGTSRPGTAQGTQPMQGMLPPKRSLRRPQPSHSEEADVCGSPLEQEHGRWDARASSSSASLVSAAAALSAGGTGQQQRGRRRQSPQLSSGPVQSLGSLGSGFGCE